LIDQAEEDGGADVFSAERPGHHGGKDIEGGGLATTRFWGIKTQARAEVEGGEGVGVGGPEAEGIGSAGRQDEVKGITGSDLVQDVRAGLAMLAVHGFGPRLDGGQLDGVGLGLEVELGAVFGDLGVEGFDAELEAFGFGAAGAVVFGRGEAGEEGKGVLIAGLMDWGRGGLVDSWMDGCSMLDSGCWNLDIGFASCGSEVWELWSFGVSEC